MAPNELTSPRRDRLLHLADRVRYRPGLRYVVPLTKALVKYRGKRRAHLLEAEFLALGTHRDYAVADAPDRAHYVVLTSDQSVGRFIYSWGTYERNQLERAVERAHVALGKTIIDVGANLGTASISGLRAGWFDQALAIEADPDNARLIRANIALNGLDDVMTCLPVACGAESGTARFAVDPARRGNSRVALNGQIEVPMQSLAEICAHQGLTVDDIGLIWVDVEGFEEQVIQGAGDLFTRVPWVLEIRSVLVDVAPLARLLQGRRVLVLSEHDQPSNRELSSTELADIITGRVRDVALDVLVLPLGS